MGKDPNFQMTDTMEDDAFSEDEVLDVDGSAEDDDEVVETEGGYMPKGFSIQLDVTPPKRKSNLTGREGIKWFELLQPITEHPGQWAKIYSYPFADEDERKRKASLCASKSASIRRNLEVNVPNEDWDVIVRTSEDASEVGIFAKYHGELTPERKEFKEKRKASYRGNRG
jgi:hypothetical protein